MRHVSAAACRKICFSLGRFAARGAFAFSKIALSCTYAGAGKYSISDKCLVFSFFKPKHIANRLLATWFLMAALNFVGFMVPGGLNIILPIRWTEMLLKLMLKNTPLWKVFLIKLKVIYWKVLKQANMGQQRALKPDFPWYMVVQIILKRLMRTGVLLFSSFRMEADSWWMSISKPKHLRC